MESKNWYYKVEFLLLKIYKILNDSLHVPEHLIDKIVSFLPSLRMRSEVDKFTVDKVLDWKTENGKKYGLVK